MRLFRATTCLQLPPAAATEMPPSLSFRGWHKMAASALVRKDELLPPAKSALRELPGRWANVQKATYLIRNHRGALIPHDKTDEVKDQPDVCITPKSTGRKHGKVACCQSSNSVQPDSTRVHPLRALHSHCRRLQETAAAKYAERFRTLRRAKAKLVAQNLKPRDCAAEAEDKPSDTGVEMKTPPPMPPYYAGEFEDGLPTKLLDEGAQSRHSELVRSAPFDAAILKDMKTFAGVKVRRSEISASEIHFTASSCERFLRKNGVIPQTELGRGGFGQVFRANFANQTDKDFAMKVIYEKSKSNAIVIRTVLAILKLEASKLKGILQVEDFAYVYLPNLNFGGPPRTNCLLVKMPLCSQSVGQHSDRDSEFLLKYGRSMVRAVQSLWEHDLVHYDIKKENALITCTGDIVLGDHDSIRRKGDQASVLSAFPPAFYYYDQISCYTANYHMLKRYDELKAMVSGLYNECEKRLPPFPDARTSLWGVGHELVSLWLNVGWEESAIKLYPVVFAKGNDFSAAIRDKAPPLKLHRLILGILRYSTSEAELTAGAFGELKALGER